MTGVASLGGPAATVVLIVAVLWAICAQVKIGFAPLLTLLEKKGTMAALKRSWKLTHGRFLPSLAIVLVVTAATTLIRLLPTYGVGLLSGFLLPWLPERSATGLVVGFIFPFEAYAALAGFVAYLFYLRHIGADVSGETAQVVGGYPINPSETQDPSSMRP